MQIKKNREMLKKCYMDVDCAIQFSMYAMEISNYIQYIV